MIPHQDVLITTLTDNSAVGRGILAEWGLSVLVEAGGRTVLLDTGASITTTNNASVMKVDLSSVETVVLSHGHWDHTGGMRDVLQAIGHTVPVVAHPAALQPKYGSRGGEMPPRYNGLPFLKEELERLGAEFRLATEPTWITDDIVASGEEPMRTGFEHVSESLVLWENGTERPDPLDDDQSLYIVTDLGLVVILGCAHRGMINIVEHAREITGVDRVYLVLGGTHLVAADEKQLEETIQAIRRLDIRHLGVSHCTGPEAAVDLAAALGDRFFFNHAGMQLRLPIETE
jgi:7,8-dihydropterin-6-yl-methyl-4-(beta-D-ribofuranosyl)aminobenzene 5'-phosphate synthase